MKLWIKYGLFNAIIGLFIGLYIAFKLAGNGYYVYIFVIPLSIFLVGGLLWQFIIDENLQNQYVKIGIISLVTGTLSFYISFVILSTLMTVCFWLPNFNNSLGTKPAEILVILKGAFSLGFLRLIFYALFTVPSAIIIGVLIWLTRKKIVPSTSQTASISAL